MQLFKRFEYREVARAQEVNSRQVSKRYKPRGSCASFERSRKNVGMTLRS